MDAEAPARPPEARKGAQKRKRAEVKGEKKKKNATLAKYERTKVSAPPTKDKKLRGRISQSERLIKDAVLTAAKAEILLPSEAGFLEPGGLAKTYQYKQDQIAGAVDVQSAQKVFDLDMESFGPYKVDYSRNGRFLLMAGKKGHVGVIDWSRNKLQTELQLKEAVRDAKFLHNQNLFAVAQKKNVYIYDNKGTETHILRSHVNVTCLEYLPYHWLLASVGLGGALKYQDTSTGTLVADHRTKLGRCDYMVQNPRNAVICLAHYNGTVTMWTPNMTDAVVKMACHQGRVTALAVDNGGEYLVTAGTDAVLKVWDLRTYKLLHSYFTVQPVSSISISGRGILAASNGPHITMWKDALASKQNAPYMTHMIGGASIKDIQFVPFDDVLGIGHSKGISSILVPGSGEPNFDSFEDNPYQTPKEAKEAAVHALLEKIQPEMISLDPDFVGRVDRGPKEVLAKEKQAEFEANHPHKEKKEKKKVRRTKGKFRKKQKNVIDEKMAARDSKEQHEKFKAAAKERKDKKRQKLEEMQTAGILPSALSRFEKD